MRLNLKAILHPLLVIALLLFGTSSVSRAQKESAPTADSKIIECVRNGEVGCVSEFLSRGGNAKAVDEKGLPLLIIASETKSATVVRLLLNAGADANDVGAGDATPLCRAALFGRRESAQTLLEAGAKADVICDSDHGDSALMEAIQGAMFSETPFETFLEPGQSPESAASANNYLEIARMLLARGVDVNVVAKCDVGESALMYAAMAANVTMVKALLAQGADVRKESPILEVLKEVEMEYRRAKWTPVPVLSRQQTGMVDWMEKTKPRREEIVRLLKAAGAKENERDQEPVDYKEGAEDYAREAFSDVIERNDQKDLERLVSAYSNHPLGTSVLPNALRVAVIYSRVEMVKLLLQRDVNPNTPSTSVKYTPLMQAASSAHLELVKLLIDAGADLNAEDDSGHTALDAAEMYTQSSEEHRTVVAFLKERGARNGMKKN